MTFVNEPSFAFPEREHAHLCIVPTEEAAEHARTRLEESRVRVADEMGVPREDQHPIEVIVRHDFADLFGAPDGAVMVPCTIADLFLAQLRARDAGNN